MVLPLHPSVSPSVEHIRHRAALQEHVLNQMKRPKFVVADTMDLWLNIALADLIKLIKRPESVSWVGFVKLSSCDVTLGLSPECLIAPPQPPNQTHRLWY